MAAGAPARAGVGNGDSFVFEVKFCTVIVDQSIYNAQGLFFVPTGKECVGLGKVCLGKHEFRFI